MSYSLHLALVLAFVTAAAGASPQAPAPPPELICDQEFSDARLPPDWDLPETGFRVADGSLSNPQGNAAIACYGDPFWEDYTLSVRMRTVRKGEKPWSVGRILFRYAGSGTFYYLLLHDTGTLELGAERAGVHCPGLQTVTTDAIPTDWHTFRVRVEGSEVHVHLDNEPAFTFRDPTPVPQGRMGLQGFQQSVIEVDRVRITSSSIHARQWAREQRRTRILAELGYEAVPKGNVAIFRAPDAPGPDSCPSDPGTLATWLRDAGYGATFLSAGEMGDEALLVPEVFDILVLPYGTAFPRRAMQALRQYLAGGGHLFTTGGYFADHLYGPSGHDTPSTPAEPWLKNGDFSEGLRGWSRNATAPGFEVQSLDNELVLTTGPALPLDWYNVHQAVSDLEPGTHYRAGARVRTEELYGGHGAYLAVESMDENGKRLGCDQSQLVSRTSGRRDLEVVGTIPQGTAEAAVNLIVHGYGRAFFSAVRVTPHRPGTTALNTRTGDIKGPGNSLRVSDDQLGLFAPNYPLLNVTGIAPSPGQAVLSGDFQLSGDIRGWSASGLFTGNGRPIEAVQHARPTYLLDCHDRFGRLQGRAGVLVRNYRGRYAGSNWAAFGVTSHDLFAEERPGSRALLLDTVAALLTPVSLLEGGTTLACYDPGETPELVAALGNSDSQAHEVEVRSTVFAEDADVPVFSDLKSLTLPPGKGLSKVTWQLPDQGLDRDFYRVRMECRINGRTVDRLDSAFVIWQPDSLDAVPGIGVRDRYVAWDGRASFACGTNESGYPYHSQSETPLVWHQQFQLMNDLGLRVYRCMHFFHGIPEEEILAFPGYEALSGGLLERIRRLDALVYLANRHGILFMLVGNCELQLARWNARELAARQRLLEATSRRYAQVPLFMVNQDHQEFMAEVRPEPHAAFQRFLAQRYPEPPLYADAWGERAAVGGPEAASFTGTIPAGVPPHSAPARDTAEFLDSFREAWRANHADAVHRGSHSALVSQDFSLYWWPDFRWPEPEVMAKLDLVSTHFYGFQSEFAVRCKRIDMRLAGKPAAMTEFGVLTHPAWEGHRDARLEPDRADAFFAMTTHWAFATGMTMMTNWNWKEMRECIFPWALAQHDLVPKPHLHAYRNLAHLLGSRLLTPVYTPPEVFVVCRSSRYLAGDFRAVEQALTACIADLLGRGFPLGVVGEQYMESVPDDTRLVVLPLLPDEASEPFPPGLPDSVEVCRWTEPGDAARFLTGISKAPVRPSSPELQVFQVPLEAPQGSAITLLNPTREAIRATVKGARDELVLSIPPERPALVRFGPNGQVLALEAQDRVLLNGNPLMQGRGHVILMPLGSGGLAERSGPILVMAIGEVDADLLWGGDTPMVLEFGEVQGGQWVPLERSQASQNRVRIVASGPLRSGIAILAPARGTEEAREAALRMLRP